MFKWIRGWLLHRSIRKQAKILDNFVRYNGQGEYPVRMKQYTHIFWIFFDLNNQWYIEEALHENTNELLLTAVEEHLGIMR